MKTTPTPERLRERLLLDEESGRFFWKEAQDLPKSWNTRYAGKEALCTLSWQGYNYGSVDGCSVAAHRAVWAYIHGAWPTADIDHINGVTTDNRLENLRDVSHRDNQRNMRRPRSNASGVTGVNWHKRDKRWRAFIEVSGRSIHLGNFQNMEDAVAARLAANAEHGFHAGHGKVLAR